MKLIYPSSIVENQLPDFVRDENPKFTLFIKKYYEWLEQTNNVIGLTETLYEAKDLDRIDTDSQYFTEITNEILPYFPLEILLDKTKFIKNIGNFYRSKGSVESLKFLFRVLYNEEIEVYFPGEQVIKASDGKWILPLALRVETADENIFDIEGLKITGSSSKSTAVVEKVIRSVDRQLGIEYIELYVSNVNKLFRTGENVSATIVSTGNLISGNTQTTVSAKLIGSLSQIKIDPDARGLFYNGFNPELNYDGDPVTIIGGLNPLSSNPIGAVATVGDVLSGSVNDIKVINGGFGFRDPSLHVGSSLIDFTGGFSDGILGAEAKAQILLLDDKETRTINVSNYTIESFHNEIIDDIDNVTDDKTIDELTTKQTLDLSSISFVSVEASGGGYRSKPSTEVYSFYLEEYDDTIVINSTTAIKGSNILRDESLDLRDYFEVGETVKLFVKNKFEEIKTIANVDINTITLDSFFDTDINNVQVFKVNRRKLTEIGSLGRFNILNGGNGYSVGDYLQFQSRGRGYGANAEVSQIHSANGGIKSIQINETSDFVRGGEGYTMVDLPTITVDSPGGGTGAIIRVSEILGDGENIQLSTTRIGAITNLRVSSFGYDYVEAPTISLRNADLGLSNVTEGRIFVSSTKIYQGESNLTPTWSAFVDRYVSSNNTLRIYDYKGTFDRELEIHSDDNEITANITTAIFYGDGRAKAEATFENGLIRYPGIYLNTDGQPSADKKLQDSNKFHNYSYEIVTENDYKKFSKSLKEVLHPIGTKSFVTRIDDNQVDVANVSVNVFSVTKKLIPNSFFFFANTTELLITDPNVDLNVETSYVVSSPVSINYGLTTIDPEGLAIIEKNSIWIIEKTFLQLYAEANDKVIIQNVNQQINGTLILANGSNVITGNGTNFINDLYDGQTIKAINENFGSTYLISTEITDAEVDTIGLLSIESGVVLTLSKDTIFTIENYPEGYSPSGEIVLTIKEVSNANSMIVLQTISSTYPELIANVFFDEIRTVTFANNSLITVDIPFTLNSFGLSVIVEKSE